jgi:small subunit ribosomal protein S17
MGQRRILTGRVIRSKTDKTIVVEVPRLRRHRLYGKVVRKNTRLMAHDEHNACEVGDTVRIVESRPISRRKRWAVAEILTGR